MEGEVTDGLINWLKTVDLFEVAIILGVTWLALRGLFKSIPVMNRVIEGLTQIGSLETMKTNVEKITEAVYEVDENGKLGRSKIEKIETDIVLSKEADKALVEKTDRLSNEFKLYVKTERRQQNGPSEHH